MSADAKIEELGLELPPAPKPAGTYLPIVQDGNTVYVSGHGPLRADKSMFTGKVYNTGCFDRIGDDFVAHPKPGIARHGYAHKPKFHEFMDT